MDWQEIVSLAVVVLTAALMTRRLWSRRKRAQTPCGHPCVYLALREEAAKRPTLNVVAQKDILVYHKQDR